MEKKFYNCYSTNMMKFFTLNDIMPTNMFFHSTTKKRVWVYELNDTLSTLLTQWSLNKK